MINIKYLVVFVIMLSISVNPALAQPSSKTSQGSGSEQTTEGGSGKVIEFKRLTLEGTVQRPSAAYFFRRKKLKFKGLIPKKSFISKIKKSVTRPPF